MIMLVPVRIFATEEADPLSVYDFSDINSVLKMTTPLILRTVSGRL